MDNRDISKNLYVTNKTALKQVRIGEQNEKSFQDEADEFLEKTSKENLIVYGTSKFENKSLLKQGLTLGNEKQVNLTVDNNGNFAIDKSIVLTSGNDTQALDIIALKKVVKLPEQVINLEQSQKTEVAKLEQSQKAETSALKNTIDTLSSTINIIKSNMTTMEFKEVTITPGDLDSNDYSVGDGRRTTKEKSVTFSSNVLEAECMLKEWYLIFDDQTPGQVKQCGVNIIDKKVNGNNVSFKVTFILASGSGKQTGMSSTHCRAKVVIIAKCKKNI